MYRKQIINDLKQNLQKISQVIILIEQYDHSEAGVELDLMQKNVALLYENYVKLKLSYEKRVIDETRAHSSPSVSVPPLAVIPAVELVLPNVEEVIAPQAQPSLGFNFNLGDDEGKINQRMESKDEKNTPVSGDFSLNQAIDEALNIALKQTTHTKVESPKVLENEMDKSINDHFSSLKTDINLADKHLRIAITDLSKEISLNKKFAFVNELFNGNMDHYSTAIQQLNTIGSADYARKYINELKVNLKWNRENPAVAEFVDMVERRWER